mmetsp:Transcript_16460/g.47273  ORF Transcript_16460/g.47273 Transcript_16460/m.47273 type:complete len:250 (+) Transcript_16460:2415-3164(+)
MALRSALAVLVVQAREAAAIRHLPPRRTRRIRAQGDAVEVADADAVAGERAEEVDVSARIRRRPRADRRTVAGLHLLPLVLGVRGEAIRDGLGRYQGLALRAGAQVKTEAIGERQALDPGRDPLREIRSGREIGAGSGVGVGVIVAADRLPDAAVSGVDLIRRQEVRTAAEVEVETGVDHALRRNKDATRSVVGAGLHLLHREGIAGAPGVKVMTVRIGIRSGAEGAPEVDPIRVLLLGGVDVLLADLD